MFEKYIARCETVENIVSSVLKNGASGAFDTIEEVSAYQNAWESLGAEEQMILKIMCNSKLTKMKRIQKAEENLHVSQAQSYRLKEKTLEKLAQRLF